MAQTGKNGHPLRGNDARSDLERGRLRFRVRVRVDSRERRLCKHTSCRFHGQRDWRCGFCTQHARAQGLKPKKTKKLKVRKLKKTEAHSGKQGLETEFSPWPKNASNPYYHEKTRNNRVAAKLMKTKKTSLKKAMRKLHVEDKLPRRPSLPLTFVEEEEAAFAKEEVLAIPFTVPALGEDLTLTRCVFVFLTRHCVSSPASFFLWGLTW